MHQRLFECTMHLHTTNARTGGMQKAAKYFYEFIMHETLICDAVVIKNA